MKGNKRKPNPLQCYAELDTVSFSSFKSFCFPKKGTNQPSKKETELWCTFHFSCPSKNPTGASATLKAAVCVCNRSTGSHVVTIDDWKALLGLFRFVACVWSFWGKFRCKVRDPKMYPPLETLSGQNREKTEAKKKSIEREDPHTYQLLVCLHNLLPCCCCLLFAIYPDRSQPFQWVWLG